MKRNKLIQHMASIFLLIFLPIITFGFEVEEPKAFIKGRVTAGLNGDTITLHLFDKHSAIRQSFRKFFKETIFTTVVKEGKFVFEIPLHEKAHYFNLYSGRKKSVWMPRYSHWNSQILDNSRMEEVPVIEVENGFLEPGDDLEIIFSLGNLGFRGQGAEKINFLHALKTSPDVPKFFSILMGEVSSVDTSIKVSDKIKVYELQLLEKYKPNLSTTAYQLLYTDIIGKNNYYKYKVGGFFSLKDTVKRNAMLTFFRENLLKDKKHYKFLEIPDDILGLSMYHAESVYKQISAHSGYTHWMKRPDLKTRIRKKEKPDEVFNIFSTSYNGLLRDKLMTLYILGNMGSLSHDAFEVCLNRALKVMENNCYRQNVLMMNANFIKGSLAVNFSMIDPSGKPVRLSDFKGKVVFVDMWFTGCGFCKVVANAMPEVTRAFKDNDEVVFLSISIDKDKETWLRSIDDSGSKSYEYRFTGDYYAGDEAIYLNTGGQGAEVPFVKKYVLFGYPTLLIIDKEGKIFTFDPTRPGEGRSELLIEELKAALKADQQS